MGCGNSAPAQPPSKLNVKTNTKQSQACQTELSEVRDKVPINFRGGKILKISPIGIIYAFWGLKFFRIGENK